MHPVQQQQQVAIQPQQAQQQFLAHSLVQLMAQEEHQADLQQEQQDQMMVHEVSLTLQVALPMVQVDRHLQVEHQPQVEHQLQPVVKVAQRVVYSDSLVQHQQQMEHQEQQVVQPVLVDQQQHQYQQLTSSSEDQELH